MSRTAARLSVIVLAVLLGACSFGGGSPSTSRGAFYKSDGPPRKVPRNIDRIPDAVPRIEPLASGPNRPYTIRGQRYVPDTSERPYRVRGRASWYGRMFHGRKTSNGETYDMFAMTAAHTTLPIPSYVRVTRVSNGRSVIVRVNDRGPFLRNRVIDLSYAAARRLDMVEDGSAEVIVERITPQEIRSGSWRKGSGARTASAPAPQAQPVVHRAAPVTHTSVASGPVFVQIGAFREAANARALASRAAAAMPGNLPVEMDVSADRFHRVRIGPFSNREQALGAIDMIERSLGVRATISLP